MCPDVHLLFVIYFFRYEDLATLRFEVFLEGNSGDFPQMNCNFFFPKQLLFLGAQEKELL